jgi:hypothetical protein
LKIKQNGLNQRVVGENSLVVYFAFRIKLFKRFKHQSDIVGSVVKVG